MARMETVLRVLVASPNDMVEECGCLEAVVGELNNTWSKSLGIKLELVRWETHTYPGIASDAQAVINEEISDDYDIFIGFLWTRFGTPTKRSQSGTLEEFERAYERYQKNPDKLRIMFYFKNAPIPPDSLDLEQMAKIKEFRTQLGEMGALYRTYSDAEDFETCVRMHLCRLLQEWNKSWGTGFEPSSATFKEPENPEDKKLDQKVAEQDEEEGFLDLLELGLEKFEGLQESTERMSAFISELGSKMEERTEEMGKIEHGKTFNLGAAKKISNRAAEDMEQFVSRMKAEIPIFADCYSIAMDAYGSSAMLLPDFQGESDDIIEAIKEAIDTTSSMSSVQDETLDSTRGFRQAIASFPRILRRFNRAKRECLRVMDALIEEMERAKNLTSLVEKTMSDVLKGLEN